MALGDAASRASATGAYRRGGDVGEIGGNTGSVDNIVQSQLVDERTGLEEEGQRLIARRCVVSLGVRLRRLREKIEKRRRGRLHTCPIPPEAPATTITPDWSASRTACTRNFS